MNLPASSSDVHKSTAVEASLSSASFELARLHCRASFPPEAHRTF